MRSETQDIKKEKKDHPCPLQNVFPIECLGISTFIALNEILFFISQGTYLLPLGIATIKITNCFVGSQKMQLVPVIISNFALFQISKCGSGTTYTFHYPYAEGNRACPSPPGNASSRFSAMHVPLRAQGSLLNTEHCV